MTFLNMFGDAYLCKWEWGVCEFGKNGGPAVAHRGNDPVGHRYCRKHRREMREVQKIEDKMHATSLLRLWKARDMRTAEIETQFKARYGKLPTYEERRQIEAKEDAEQRDIFDKMSRWIF